MKRLIVLFILLFPIYSSQAQNHHEVGISAGVSNYYGDLQDKWFPKEGYRPNGGIFYKYFMSPHFGIRAGLNYTQINAADSLSDIPAKQARNLDFNTRLLEFHGGLEINLLPIDIDRMKVTPYIFGGIALFYFNPYSYNKQGEKIYLRPLSTEGQGLSQYPDRKQYSLVNVSFPFGGGLKFLIGKKIIVTTEIGFRYTATDYLDDVSRSYINLDTLKSVKGEQAVNYSYKGNLLNSWDGKYPNYKYQRGDSKANDWYYFMNLNVAIYFSAFGNIKHYLQTVCPSFFGKKAKKYYQ